MTDERSVIDAAVRAGVVDARAVEDPEGYDNFQTLGRLQAMAVMLRAAACPHCREVYEIWAGIEGFEPQTAPEAYQQKIIDQMREAAEKGVQRQAEPPIERTAGE